MPLVPKLDVASLPVVIAPGGNVNLYVREESTMVPYVPPPNELASRRTDHKKETFQRTLLFQSKQGRQNQDIPHFVFEFWR